MDFDSHFIFAQAPTHELKDRMQLVLVLTNGDLRAVDIFDLADPKSERELMETILKYESMEPGSFGPHGYFDDYKFFWTDTNGFKTEMKLSLKLKEGIQDGENLPDQS